MTLEWKYVRYHPGNKAALQPDNITNEMNRWVAEGWTIEKVLRPSLIGPVDLVLSRSIVTGSA